MLSYDMQKGSNAMKRNVTLVIHGDLLQKEAQATFRSDLRHELGVPVSLRAADTVVDVPDPQMWRPASLGKSVPPELEEAQQGRGVWPPGHGHEYALLNPRAAKLLERSCEAVDEGGSFRRMGHI